jgi:hypothetical protein
MSEKPKTQTLNQEKLHIIWVLAGTTKMNLKMWENLKLRNLKPGFYCLHQRTTNGL